MFVQLTGLEIQGHGVCCFFHLESGESLMVGGSQYQGCVQEKAIPSFTASDFPEN